MHICVTWPQCVNIFSLLSGTALIWMSQDLSGDKSMLIHVTACCHQWDWLSFMMSQIGGANEVNREEMITKNSISCDKNLSDIKKLTLIKLYSLLRGYSPYHNEEIESTGTYQENAQSNIPSNIGWFSAKKTRLLRSYVSFLMHLSGVCLAMNLTYPGISVFLP